MLKKLAINILVLAMVCLCVPAGHSQAYFETQEVEMFNYGPFRALLARYVDVGRVDYIAWKQRDMGAFEKYIETLKDVNVDNMTEDQQKAFWINAYNAFTIYGVLQKVPTKHFLAKAGSVKMVPGFFDKITYEVAREDLTLDAIEKVKLSEGFKDPRIHFAIVSASRSSPLLPSTTYDPVTLDRMLDKAAINFIGDGVNNKLDQINNTLYLSQIFEWYEQDFVGAAGSVVNYIKKYISERGQIYLEENTPEIKYLTYNWFLNLK